MSTAAASQRHQDHWLGRIWRSLEEPPLVTAGMVLEYGVLAIMGATILLSPGALFVDTAAACILIIIGGVAASAFAWRGAWWGEAPAVGVIALGVGIITTVDTLRAIDAHRWWGFPSMLAIAVLINLLVRLARIWPALYAPGKEPDSVERRAHIRAEVQVALAIDVLGATQDDDEEDTA